MKATGILLAVLAGLLLCGSLFFGYFSYHNAGAAERLSSRLRPEARFIVRSVENKSKGQRNLSLGLGVPGIIALGLSVVLIKKGRRLAA